MKRIVVLLCILSIVQCKNPFAAKKAKIEVTGQSSITSSFGKPGIRITVKNTGDAVGYNVGVDVQAVNSSVTIVDIGRAFPADLGNINPGQSAVDDAIFFSLSSHSDYASTEIDVSWLTRDD